MTRKQNKQHCRWTFGFFWSSFRLFNLHCSSLWRRIVIAVLKVDLITMFPTFSHQQLRSLHFWLFKYNIIWESIQGFDRGTSQDTLHDVHYFSAQMGQPNASNLWLHCRVEHLIPGVAAKCILTKVTEEASCITPSFAVFLDFSSRTPRNHRHFFDQLGILGIFWRAVCFKRRFSFLIELYTLHLDGVVS